MYSIKIYNNMFFSSSYNIVTLCNANFQAGHAADLPKEVPGNFEENETFLKQAHHALMEVCIWHSLNLEFNIFIKFCFFLLYIFQEIIVIHFI